MVQRIGRGVGIPISSIYETITGTNPAAGAEISQTIPFGEVWDLYAVRVQLVSSVTATTRTPRLVIDDGTNILWTGVAGVGQIESLTRRYIWSLGHIEKDSAFNPDDTAINPLGFIGALPPNFRVRTITENLQSGDDYAAPVLYVERWLYDAQ